MISCLCYLSAPNHMKETADQQDVMLNFNCLPSQKQPQGQLQRSVATIQQEVLFCAENTALSVL